MIANAFNPSSTEVREWAYDASAVDPTEDFDLILAGVRHEKDYLDFASDPACPKRGYFVRILYLIVGDAVRSKYGTLPEPILRGFLERAAEYRDPAIQLWRQRSLELMRDPKTFEYDAWCAGGLAKAAT